MPTLQSESVTPSDAEPTFVWERQMRPTVDAIARASDGGASRGVVVGNAGSGKSATLRHLHRLLVERKRPASLVGGDARDLEKVSPSHVLLVDDLHLMHPEQVERIAARSMDPDAALVVASRPWPASDAVNSITRQLERTRPAIVLGHVSRSDVLTFLEGSGQAISDDCVEHILAVTGGVSWLVTEALLAHDARDCRDDPAHNALGRALQERIAHRLDTVDPQLRDTVELLCVAAPGHARSLPEPADESSNLVMQGYAEGLLARNGQPVPLVRSTVRATIPVRRLVDLSDGLADGLAHAAAAGDPTYREWVGALRDPQVGAALVTQADRILGTHPRRAAELYRGAIESGIDAATLTGRQAQAAWASGDLDTAGRILDSASADIRRTDSDRIADTSAATWAARAMMQQADAVYRAVEPKSAESTVRSAIVGLAVGDSSRLAAAAEAAPTDTAPSVLGVSMDLLRKGLAASIAPESAQTMLGDLVRASEMYTASRASAPIAELPAVIAAIVAINVGDITTAHSVIEQAIAGGHGGQWARMRLLLWRSWIAVQRARPSEARESLLHALKSSKARTPRDMLLAQAIRVAIARRYEDRAGLESAWQKARPSILHIDVDLFMLLPLAELICSAARVGDAERMDPYLARGIEIVDQLGSPGVWSAHLRWAGIQEGILRNRPDDIVPHAHALVAAASHSRVAATMAKAGRVWMSVLAGSVNPDAVEAVAQRLAAIGLNWDAARLAGHGASRADDRKVSARLLACAREHHPAESTRKSAPSNGEETPEASGPTTQPEQVLSERELEVAKLVLQGKTYAEIGETIYISPRTAEHHIASIRRRLGATSRSDVIAKLRQLIGDPASPEQLTHAREEGGPLTP